jgi:hypothetical protein
MIVGIHAHEHISTFEACEGMCTTAVVLGHTTVKAVLNWLNGEDSTQPRYYSNPMCPRDGSEPTSTKNHYNSIATTLDNLAKAGVLSRQCARVRTYSVADGSYDRASTAAKAYVRELRTRQAVARKSVRTSTKKVAGKKRTTKKTVR